MSVIASVGMSNERTVHGQSMSKSVWTNMDTPKSVQKIFCSNGRRSNTPMIQMDKTKWTWVAQILKISRISFIGGGGIITLFSCRQIHERALLGFILFTVALTLLTQSSRNLPLPSSRYYVYLPLHIFEIWVQTKFPSFWDL